MEMSTRDPPCILPSTGLHSEQSYPKSYRQVGGCPPCFNKIFKLSFENVMEWFGIGIKPKMTTFLLGLYTVGWGTQG